MWKKVSFVSIFVLIVGGSLAASKKSDADILTKVGRTSTEKILSNLPDRSRVAGPFAQVQLGDLTNLEDKVRVRLRTEASLETAKFAVTSQGTTIKIAGKVNSPVQRDRALELAKTTTGVTAVESEIAVLEGK